jgi:hypothetical protein
MEVVYCCGTQTAVKDDLVCSGLGLERLRPVSKNGVDNESLRSQA